MNIGQEKVVQFVLVFFCSIDDLLSSFVNDSL